MLLLASNLGSATSLRKRAKKGRAPVPLAAEPSLDECPVGIDPAQWETLDMEQRRQVAEQVAKLMPPPPVPPLEIEMKEDQAVAWETWDADKYQEAWKGVNNASADDAATAEGSTTNQKQVVDGLIRRGWRPLHVAAAAGKVADVQTLLDYMAPLVNKVELLRDRVRVPHFRTGLHVNVQLDGPVTDLILCLHSAARVDGIAPRGTGWPSRRDEAAAARWQACKEGKSRDCATGTGEGKGEGVHRGF